MEDTGCSSPQKRPKLSHPKQRKFTKIPVYVVEWHNEVLEFVYRCIASRHLPLEGNTMVHFDSHPDMVISNQLKPDTVFDKIELLSQLSIENWILPTCYAGHFNKLIWAKNTWCCQMPTGIHSFEIGTNGERICVSLPLEYFVFEGNYCEKDSLTNSKSMKLEVINIERESEANILEKEDSIVLDIDLDFFSTTDPFVKIYEKSNTYERVKEIFFYPNKPEVKAKEVSAERRKQLEELKEVFDYLQEHRSLDGFTNKSIAEGIYTKIIELIDEVKKHYEDDDIDWLIIYDTGCTCDNDGLPHHISTKEELQEYYENFEKFIRKLPTEPVLITISRSSMDDYCPQEQVEEIQDAVLKILSKIYGDRITDRPILAYEGDEWDVMTL